MKYFGFVASFVCASAYAFVVATSSKLHDMFHLLRMNVAISYIMVGEQFSTLINLTHQEWKFGFK